MRISALLFCLSQLILFPLDLASQGFVVSDQIPAHPSGAYKNYPAGLVELSDSSIFTGVAEAASLLPRNLTYHHYRSNGQLIRHLSSPFGYETQASFLAALPQNDILVIGQVAYPSYNYYARITPLGDTVWIKGFNDTLNVPHRAAVDSSGIIGIFSGLPNCQSCFYFQKEDFNGQVIWQKPAPEITTLLNSLGVNLYDVKKLKSLNDSFYLQIDSMGRSLIFSYATATGSLGIKRNLGMGLIDFFPSTRGMYLLDTAATVQNPQNGTLKLIYTNRQFVPKQEFKLNSYIAASDAFSVASFDGYASYSIAATSHKQSGDFSIGFLNNYDSTKIPRTGLLRIDTLGNVVFNKILYPVGVVHVMENMIDTHDGSTLFQTSFPTLGTTWTGGSWLVKVAPDGTVSLPEVKPGGSLAIYPNPAKDHFYLQGLKPNSTVNRIALFSLNGQLIADLLAPETGAKIELPAKVKNGLYLLQVYTDEGRSTQKLEVNR